MTDSIANSGSRLLTDAIAIKTARKAARRVHSEGSLIPLEDLEQIACLEAIRVVRQAPATATATRPGLLYRSCREACVRSTVRERQRSSDHDDYIAGIKRESQSLSRACSWSYVRREPIPDPGHITCYVWSFTLRSNKPQLLRRAIDKLCSAQRDAAKLVLLQGLTQQQAAERLGCTQPSICQRMKQACKNLKQILRQRL